MREGTDDGREICYYNLYTHFIQIDVSILGLACHAAGSEPFFPKYSFKDGVEFTGNKTDHQICDDNCICESANNI